MSKKKWLLIIALIILAAFIIYPYLKWNAPLAYLDDVPGYADQTKTFLMDQGIGFIGGIVSTIIGLGTLANRALSRKNKAISTLSKAKAKLETQIYNEGTIEAFKKEYGEDAFTRVETLSAEVTQTKATLKKKMTEITNWEEKKIQWDKARGNLEDERVYMKGRIKTLERDLALEKGEIQPTVKAP